MSGRSKTERLPKRTAAVTKRPHWGWSFTGIQRDRRSELAHPTRVATTDALTDEAAQISVFPVSPLSGRREPVRENAPQQLYTHGLVVHLVQVDNGWATLRAAFFQLYANRRLRTLTAKANRKWRGLLLEAHHG